MYERVFDTDWESLSGEEAIRRTYVLGIAAQLGYGNPEERSRIRALASSAYERSVLDLAFEEGKREVQDVRPMHDSDEETWEELVETEESAAPSPESLQPTRRSRETPDAVERPSVLDGYDIDELERLRLPSFLTREE
ncbi:hypothetical protein [Halobellus rufus]|uniref:hypothetical protein n=1 Tax=Halobellus rufus TaxID=1448860 RepID=UPI000678B87A|nr:hypothetical protein [Halobellus rufus]